MRVFFYWSEGEIIIIIIMEIRRRRKHDSLEYPILLTGMIFIWFTISLYLTLTNLVLLQFPGKPDQILTAIIRKQLRKKR